VNIIFVHKQGWRFSYFLLCLIIAGSLGACSKPEKIPLTAKPVALDESTPVVEDAIETQNPTFSSRWIPQAGESLQIQFKGAPIDLTQNVEVYDLDLFETTLETIQAIHSQNKKVICYLNAGAWEDWRPDADQYPEKILGKDYEGWPGEKWIDIRKPSQLEPILTARLELCKQKGFDGVEPDNLDGYQIDSGFPITEEDQLTFNRWLASQAHTLGLAIGLKNDPDQMLELEPDFDFVLMEDCFQYEWCELAAPFLKSKKPVFAVEYTDWTKSLSPYCQSAEKLGLSLFLKNRELDAFRQTCP
jgi:hypothetical protein